jgi:hypothetical protein
MRSLVSTAIAAVFVTPLFSAHAADAPAPGCYVPLRGSAASICTDQVNCTTQSGIFRIVLSNKAAGLGERRLVISGTFQGQITGETTCFGGTAPGMTLSHTLVDKSTGGSIQTEGDVGCVIGGDGVTTLQVVETLNLANGSGSYAGLDPDSKSQVVLTGTLDLTTGINTFRVEGGEGKVCFTK